MFGRGHPTRSRSPHTARGTLGLSKDYAPLAINLVRRAYLFHYSLTSVRGTDPSPRPSPPRLTRERRGGIRAVGGFVQMKKYAKYNMTLFSFFGTRRVTSTRTPHVDSCTPVGWHGTGQRPQVVRIRRGRGGTTPRLLGKLRRCRCAVEGAEGGEIRTRCEQAFWGLPPVLSDCTNCTFVFNDSGHQGYC